MLVQTVVFLGQHGSEKKGPMEVLLTQTEDRHPNDQVFIFWIPASLLEEEESVSGVACP